uniref:Uncharacterized protein n=1 Tax=Oryza glumipatula TaxID=40148 RepID=A0A0D9ZCK7_9ORYZ
MLASSVPWRIPRSAPLSLLHALILSPSHTPPPISFDKAPPVLPPPRPSRSHAAVPPPRRSPAPAHLTTTSIPWSPTLRHLLRAGLPPPPTSQLPPLRGGGLHRRLPFLRAQRQSAIDEASGFWIRLPPSVTWLVASPRWSSLRQIARRRTDPIPLFICPVVKITTNGMRLGAEADSGVPAAPWFPLHFSLSSIGDDEQPTTMEINYFYKAETDGFRQGLGGCSESASRKAFAALPDLCKAITELTVLKGVGPATASAVLAAYAPDVAPFMSDEAMVAALGNAKEYTLKQYLAFAEKLQTKSKELSSGEEVFTTSDVERALWSSAVASKSLKAPPGNDLENKKVIARPERLSYLNIIEHSDSSRKFHKEN